MRILTAILLGWLSLFGVYAYFSNPVAEIAKSIKWELKEVSESDDRSGHYTVYVKEISRTVPLNFHLLNLSGNLEAPTLVRPGSYTFRFKFAYAIKIGVKTIDLHRWEDPHFYIPGDKNYEVDFFRDPDRFTLPSDVNVPTFIANYDINRGIEGIKAVERTLLYGVVALYSMPVLALTVLAIILILIYDGRRERSYRQKLKQVEVARDSKAEAMDTRHQFTVDVAWAKKMAGALQTDKALLNIREFLSGGIEIAEQPKEIRPFLYRLEELTHDVYEASHGRYPKGAQKLVGHNQLTSFKPVTILARKWSRELDAEQLQNEAPAVWRAILRHKNGNGKTLART